MIDQDIHTAAEANNVPLPESAEYDFHLTDGKTFLRHPLSDASICEYLGKEGWYKIYAYFTDELIDRILPRVIFRLYDKTFVIDNDGVGYYGLKRMTVDTTVNQALKELLKWVIENYPDQVREHLNKKER